MFCKSVMCQSLSGWNRDAKRLLKQPRPCHSRGMKDNIYSTSAHKYPENVTTHRGPAVWIQIRNRFFPS